MWKVNRIYRFEVEGKGDFPWDMLRYDEVYPLTAPSPSIYDATAAWKVPRTVKVQGYWRCTPARWASFGWRVVDAYNAAWGELIA